MAMANGGPLFLMGAHKAHQHSALHHRRVTRGAYLHCHHPQSLVRPFLVLARRLAFPSFLKVVSMGLVQPCRRL